MVLVSSAALHSDPAGTGPSPVVIVTIAGPTWVHVKPVVAELGVLKEPVDDDQAYVSMPGLGPLAEAVSSTKPPTVTAIGVAETEFRVAQLYVEPVIVVPWPDVFGKPHAICTSTSVTA
jgi:hypothetical protein